MNLRQSSGLGGRGLHHQTLKNMKSPIIPTLLHASAEIEILVGKCGPAAWPHHRRIGARGPQSRIKAERKGVESRKIPVDWRRAGGLRVKYEDWDSNPGPIG